MLEDFHCTVRLSPLSIAPLTFLASNRDSWHSQREAASVNRRAASLQSQCEELEKELDARTKALAQYRGEVSVTVDRQYLCSPCKVESLTPRMKERNEKGASLHRDLHASAAKV